jgi:hypothetical protein
MHNIHYLHKRMVRQDDLPIQKHKLSISLLKELIEVTGIFIIGILDEFFLTNFLPFFCC